MRNLGTIFGLALLLIAGCTAKRKAVDQANVPSNQMISTTLGGHPLQIKDFAKGAGRKAERGDVLRVHFVAKSEDSKVVYSTYAVKTPYEFRVGQDELIPAWEYGLLGVQAGTKRRLIVPPALGYADIGVQGKILPDQTITYDIEVLAISAQDVDEKKL